MSKKTDHSIYDNTFNSVFAPYIVRFIEVKESGGYKVQGLYYVLKAFDRYAVEQNISAPYLTEAQYVNWWNSLPESKASTKYEKVSIIGQFCKYMAKLGMPMFIPTYPKKPHRDYVPYIFTHEELLKIFSEADNLCLKRRIMNSNIFSIPFLLRLLYSTGMRIGEACSLLNKDVNLEEDIIKLHDTKNDRDRNLPINPSLKILFNQYLYYREKLPVSGINDKDSPFLVTLNGNAMSHGTVLTWFHEILRRCGIKHIPGSGPRIHDLRHTFAVHALDKISKEGKDIYSGLPILSVALGHKCVTDTESYVRITHQVYPDLNTMTTHMAEYIFPTITIN